MPAHANRNGQDVIESFGDKIRSLREKAQLSLRQIEMLTGVSNAYLSQIELGRVGPPSPRIVERLASALGIPYLELLSAAGHLGRSTITSSVSFAPSTLDVSELSASERLEVRQFVRDLKRRRIAQAKASKRRRG
jgi:HTH-type transcriptional regulator, competence development regulator